MNKEIIKLLFSIIMILCSLNSRLRKKEMYDTQYKETDEKLTELINILKAEN